ncbi:Txe/YoeB family addiction module toxin [Flavobacterium columnare]|uniref:Putative mRNA interferase YoeB n=1 Tax=Flavobacterium columnare TaxID=996 RepID=A0AAI8CJ90_9FLAO|nr:Txe/YoeB family addiction module toxin [Flavobacterium columnare]AMO20999.1 Txe/YoeB family addiction module toxin [Flavobacterium columnare]AUX19001.1 addiction module protein [Flavobacterium columnare]MEB3802027.1 Txe/YoeB family addiction module toxin [Flavobacterium columnare]QOG58079.1 Txe/YoeB family addiction module toxin [Flavobacterium columnare]QOG60801.1 Txe/YoeB family addiction module toxin [Flavobacterium columnare]
MDIVFTPHGWDDFSYWIENNPDTVVRIKELLKAIKQDPFKGIGKPEALRHDLKGFWSRRITDEHRLVYRVSGTKGVDQRCTIIQCRFHYD